MNILIVDRDARRRGRLLRLLTGGGHVVRAIGDPQSALAHFREAPHGLVIADAASRRQGGEADLFRRIRSESSPWQSYLIEIRPAKTAAFSRRRSRLDHETDDVLSEPIREEELAVRILVAERTLGRRLEEAAQLRRITRIPADSPHPIVEVTSNGALVHANLASMPLLEAMGWVAGHPAPGPLRHLAESAAAAGRPKRAEFNCGERAFSFLAIGMEGGEICLYGHDVTGLASSAPDTGASRTQGVGLTLRDPLTGLPTQLLLTDRVGQALAQARIAGSKIALIKVNVDNCGDINAAYGHAIGDRLIVVVGECLRNEVRIGDTVLRDSGDGFVLLLQGVGGREAAGATCSRILRAAQQAGVEANLGFQVTLSMGLAMFPEDADTESALVERAELALGEAKNAGRNCWRDYPAAMGSNPMIGAERLLPRLMGALQLRQLHAQYQPIIAADSGAVAGFEALVRWHDPELGWIAPDRFIPIAETRGLIAEVGRQMADMVFRQLAVWRGSGYPV
ncbi:MAG: diguanylate cyclase, partial [Verrucomicrobiales bacterium]|nr:diguanylate cyclase [Verrucomicrobiales bacterium]